MKEEIKESNMSELKFKLTKESKINAWGGKLFRIEAIVNFKNGNNEIKKGTKGGWVEKESNLSGDAWVYDNAMVYGDAWVYGDARVSGNARLIAKSAYTKGRFVGGDNSETPKFTNITDKTGSNYWRNQYVIGDYEISEIEPKAVETSETEPEIITLNGKRYKVVE